MHEHHSIYYVIQFAARLLQNLSCISPAIYAISPYCYLDGDLREFGLVECCTFLRLDKDIFAPFKSECSRKEATNYYCLIHLSSLFMLTVCTVVAD